MAFMHQNELYWHAVSIPPTETSLKLGARVEHVLVDKRGSLSEVIEDHLNLPQDFSKELIRFGAVHWCPVLPLLPGSSSSSESHHESAQLARRTAMARLGKNPKHSQPKRATTDEEVDEFAYIRVHVHPKRFPNAHNVDWKARIVRLAPGYVVINKPAGVPVVPTVDNILESCLACTAQAIGSEAPLLSTHRLDTCTEGLVVLGRTRSFVAAFNELLRQEGAVKKYYKALTASQPTTGTLVHYVTVGKRIKGLPAHTEICSLPVEGSQHCELEIIRSAAVSLGPSAQSMGWPKTAYESLILLKTGRTHQIRAQLAAVGAPILGDTMYEPLARQPNVQSSTGEGDPSEVLECPENAAVTADLCSEPELAEPIGQDSLCIGQSISHMALAAQGRSAHVEDESLTSSSQERSLNEPRSSGIGLQACRLEVHKHENIMGQCPAVFEADSAPQKQAVSSFANRLIAFTARNKGADAWALSIIDFYDGQLATIVTIGRSWHSDHYAVHSRNGKVAEILRAAYRLLDMAEAFGATQFAGSQVDAEVLLDTYQPRIQFKELARRDGRQENRYYVTFDGLPESQAEWFTEQELRKHNEALLATFNSDQQENNEQEQTISSDEDMDSLNVQDFPETDPVLNRQEVVHQLFMQRQPQTQAQDAGVLRQPQTQSQGQAQAMFMQQQPQTQPQTQAHDAAILQQQPHARQQTQAQAPFLQQQPQTQAPSQSPAQPPTSAAHEPMPQRQQILQAYQRQVQATRASQPPPQPPVQQGPRIVNGIPSSLWDNCPLVRNAPAQPGTGGAAQGGNQAVSSRQAAGVSQRRPAAATLNQDAWGVQDTAELSQEDWAAAEWAVRHPAQYPSQHRSAPSPAMPAGQPVRARASASPPVMRTTAYLNEQLAGHVAHVEPLSPQQQGPYTSSPEFPRSQGRPGVLLRSAAGSNRRSRGRLDEEQFVLIEGEDNEQQQPQPQQAGPSTAAAFRKSSHWLGPGGAQSSLFTARGPPAPHQTFQIEPMQPAAGRIIAEQPPSAFARTSAEPPHQQARPSVEPPQAPDAGGAVSTYAEAVGGQTGRPQPTAAPTADVAPQPPRQAALQPASFFDGIAARVGAAGHREAGTSAPAAALSQLPLQQPPLEDRPAVAAPASAAPASSAPERPRPTAMGAPAHRGPAVPAQPQDVSVAHPSAGPSAPHRSPASGAWVPTRRPRPASGQAAPTQRHGAPAASAQAPAGREQDRAAQNARAGGSLARPSAAVGGATTAAQPAVAGAGGADVLMASISRRAAELVSQGAAQREAAGAEAGAASPHENEENVNEETWGIWARELNKLGKTVADYAAAQVLPPSDRPAVRDLLPPAPDAQPQQEATSEQEDLFEEASPALPAQKRQQPEEAGARPYKRLKKSLRKLYSLDPVPEQAEAVEDLADSGVEEGNDGHMPDAEEAPQEQQDAGARLVSPSRRSHVLENTDEEADEEEPLNTSREQEGIDAVTDGFDEEEEQPQMDDVDEYGLDGDLRQRLQPQLWEDAIITRARHEEDDKLLLKVHWADGYYTWVDRYALHVRPHCLLKLIRFYESKTKPTRK